MKLCIALLFSIAGFCQSIPFPGPGQPAAPPSFSYWRMNVLNSGSFTAASLFSFYDGTSTLIPVTGGTALASNAAFGAAASAFDGVSADFWNANVAATPASPVWLQMHFTSAVTVASIKLQARAGNFYGPNSFQMQSSNDGSTWTNQGFYNPPSAWYDNASGNVLTTTLNAASGSGTAWRLLITATQGTTFCEINNWTLKDGGGSTITTTPATGYSFADSEFDTQHPNQFAFSSYVQGKFWAGLGTPSGGSPAYLAFRFNTAVSTLGSFTITAYANASAPTAFSLQSSPDVVTWTTVQTYTASSWTDFQTKTFTVP